MCDQYITYRGKQSGDIELIMMKSILAWLLLLVLGIFSLNIAGRRTVDEEALRLAYEDVRDNTTLTNW